MSIRTQIDHLSGPKGALHEDEATAQQVAAWRRQRMGWVQIARNLGRSEPDVRKAYDPDWKARA